MTVMRRGEDLEILQHVRLQIGMEALRFGVGNQFNIDREMEDAMCCAGLADEECDLSCCA
jgi:hypothetical protein